MHHSVSVGRQSALALPAIKSHNRSGIKTNEGGEGRPMEWNCNGNGKSSRDDEHGYAQRTAKHRTHIAFIGGKRLKILAANLQGFSICSVRGTPFHAPSVPSRRSFFFCFFFTFISFFKYCLFDLLLRVYWPPSQLLCIWCCCAALYRDLCMFCTSISVLCLYVNMYARKTKRLTGCN